MSVEVACNQIAKEEWYQSLQGELLIVQKAIIESENRDERKRLLEKYDIIVLEIHDKTTEKLLQSFAS